MRGLIGALPSCTYRNAAVAVMVIVVSMSASQVLSPAALRAPSSEERAASTSETAPVVDRSEQYAWLSTEQRKRYEPLAARIPPPPGFARVSATPGGFADWLRHLPVAPEATPVTRYDGKIAWESEQCPAFAVFELQPNTRRLDSANMMLRLRAEYGWVSGWKDSVAFHLASGESLSWCAWTAGARAVPTQRGLEFVETGTIDSDRSSYCRYLESIFSFASCKSLLDDTRPAGAKDVAAGDIFLDTGHDGLVAMVLDILTDDVGNVRLLFGMGGAPALTFHVVRGPDGSAWFPISRSSTLCLPEGELTIEHLRHWVR